jgi:hypothetical protein
MAIPASSPPPPTSGREAIMMTLQRSLLFLLLALHDNTRKMFLLLKINNANGAEIEDM